MPAVRDDYYETDGSYQKVGILRVISATRSDAGEAAISNSPQMDSESLPPGSTGRSDSHSPIACSSTRPLSGLDHPMH